MTSSLFSPIKLSLNDNNKLESLIKELNNIKWEQGEYYFHNFIEYYQLPQIVRVEQTWNTDFVENQWLYLQSLFDRYIIIASLLTNKNQLVSKDKYLLPDWFPGECHILSKKPILKKRWWVFQGAFELYRFEFPRLIKILCHTPAHIKTKDNEWKKIILCKDSCLNVIGRKKYQSRTKTNNNDLFISESKDAFILQDLNTNDEFIIPPGVPLRFATLIQEHELHKEYQDHSGTFTLPEIMMRYEFPIDIEILTHLPIDLPDFKSQIKLEKFCIAKSILAYFIDNKQIKMVELSPLTNFTIRCAKCLTYGLPHANNENLKNEQFNEKEYHNYENIRSRINIIFKDIGEIHRSKIQLASIEEIECIEKAYEISLEKQNDTEKIIDKIYMTLNEAFKIIRENNNDDISRLKMQLKRFTIHASIDPSNPYKEIIDYENMDVLNQSKKNDNKSSNVVQSHNRAALVVQQLPPPIFLSPESFEKTVKIIPDILYTELLPATKSKNKRSDKTTSSK